jgi:hypothetical protein
MLKNKIISLNTNNKNEELSKIQALNQQISKLDKLLSKIKNSIKQLLSSLETKEEVKKKLLNEIIVTCLASNDQDVIKEGARVLNEHGASKQILEETITQQSTNSLQTLRAEILKRITKEEITSLILDLIKPKQATDKIQNSGYKQLLIKEFINRKIPYIEIFSITHNKEINKVRIKQIEQLSNEEYKHLVTSSLEDLLKLHKQNQSYINFSMTKPIISSLIELNNINPKLFIKQLNEFLSIKGDISNNINAIVDFTKLAVSAYNKLDKGSLSPDDFEKIILYFHTIQDKTKERAPIDLDVMSNTRPINPLAAISFDTTVAKQEHKNALEGGATQIQAYDAYIENLELSKKQENKLTLLEFISNALNSNVQP